MAQSKSAEWLYEAGEADLDDQARTRGYRHLVSAEGRPSLLQIKVVSGQEACGPESPVGAHTDASVQNRRAHGGRRAFSGGDFDKGGSFLGGGAEGGDENQAPELKVGGDQACAAASAAQDGKTFRANPARAARGLLAAFFVPIYIAGCGGGERSEPNLPKDAPFLHFQGVDLMPTAANIPCDAWLRALNAAEHPAVGVVWDTFGTDRSCLTRFLKENAHRPHAVRVHAMNETWRDDGGEGFEGDLFLGMTKGALSKAFTNRNPEVVATYRARVQEITSWLRSNENENTTAVITPGLEDVFDDAAYQVARSIIVDEWDGKIGRNPLTDGTEKTEAHGSNATCENGISIVSPDGAVLRGDASRAFLDRSRGCLISFLWSPEHQGLHVRDGKITGREVPPRARAFSFEDAQEIEGLLGDAK